MTDRDEIKKRIATLVKESVPAAKKRRSQTKIPNVNISGDSNIVGDGNVVFKTQSIIKRTTVKTGDGVIDASQKAELLRLRDEWVAANNAVRKTVLTHSSAIIKLNKKMGVNSYHEIEQERFPEARAWLMQQIARVRSMKSAPKKMPDWRSSTIRYIKARCRNQLKDEQAYVEYIVKNFGKKSLADLSDLELSKVKNYIAGKNPRPSDEI